MSEKLLKTITVPIEIYNALIYDATMFEIKRDNIPNMNNLLSSIIIGYYNRYNDDFNRKRTAIIDQLSCLNIKEEKKADIAQSILEDVLVSSYNKKRGNKSHTLHLRETYDTSGIISDIDDLCDENNYNLSGYYRNMIMAYCALPMSEREKIVFSDSYKVLQQCIDEKVCVSFCINNKKISSALPYSITVGKDGMLNYFICAIKNNEGQLETRSFRLNRISFATKTKLPCIFDDTTLKNLEKMKQFSPQHAINSDQEISVKLSPQGVNKYSRIYHERPEIVNCKGDLYYFNCSGEQIMTYFRKFGADAEIISPLSLREEMKKFYAEALENYSNKQGE